MARSSARAFLLLASVATAFVVPPVLTTPGRARAHTAAPPFDAATRGLTRARAGAASDAFKATVGAAPAATAVTEWGPEGATLSDVWEVDVYSRPVTVAGKKLWELLVTDASGTLRHVEAIPANKVNSREVRARVSALLEEAPSRPKQLRFFRRAMVNMLSIALKDIATGVSVKPSRTTHALYSWLEERDKDVYPKMAGYKAALGDSGGGIDMATPERLPDALRADQFAFVTLALSEVLPEGSIDGSNIGCGSLCPVPPGLSPDTMLPGVLFITKRAPQLAKWLAGSELAFLKADLRRRELVMETGLNTRFLTAKLNDPQRIEAQAFEAGKARLRGLHFIGVQCEAEDDDVQGFWLCREMNM